jgi:hypothetical protein
MGLRPPAPDAAQLAAMDPGELLWLAVEPVYSRVSTDSPNEFFEGFSQLLPAQGHLFAAYCAQSDVNIGGLYQFFLDSTGVMAPESARGLRFLEQAELADILERAIALFGADYPRGQERREAAVERLTRPENPFPALDAAFHKALVPFDEKVDGFIRRHMDFFFKA